MSQKDKRPKLLTEVLRAIKNLKETKGSTVKTITHSIRQDMETTEPYTKARLLIMHVHAALRYAVDSQLITHCTGRYHLKSKSSNTSSNLIQHTAKSFNQVTKQSPLPKMKKDMHSTGEHSSTTVLFRRTGNKSVNQYDCINLRRSQRLMEKRRMALQTFKFKEPNKKVMNKKSSTQKKKKKPKKQNKRHKVNDTDRSHNKSKRHSVAKRRRRRSGKY